jgi:hypothetical protein
MNKPPQIPELSNDEPHLARVPAGAPSWITTSLIQLTIKTWQPFYDVQLLPEHALEIIMGAGLMMDVLSSGDGHETVCSTG